MQGREDVEGKRDEGVAETKGDEVMTWVTTDKQRKTLEAKGWRIVGYSLDGGQDWLHDDLSACAYIDPYGNISLGEGFVNRHRLAEFLSIINGKDETVTIEGVVALRGPFFVGNVYMPDHLRSREGERVRVTIEPLDDAKEGDA
jgi:hypothetical protein